MPEVPLNKSGKPVFRYVTVAEIRTHDLPTDVILDLDPLRMGLCESQAVCEAAPTADVYDWPWPYLVEEVDGKSIAATCQRLVFHEGPHASMLVGVVDTFETCRCTEAYLKNPQRWPIITVDRSPCHHTPDGALHPRLAPDLEFEVVADGEAEG